MNMFRNAALLAACLFAGPALAQSTRPPPLNLQLPPGDVPAAAGTVAHPPAAPATPAHDAHGNATSPPGVYYGDTSGRAGNEQARVAYQCDDSTYNQPQTHGSFGMGVMGGDHLGGAYQTGTVSVTKNLGSCDHPTGSVGFSISVGQGRFHGRRW